jgi:hypothetical protein
MNTGSPEQPYRRLLRLARNDNADRERPPADGSSMIIPESHPARF